MRVFCWVLLLFNCCFWICFISFCTEFDTFLHVLVSVLIVVCLFLCWVWQDFHVFCVGLDPHQATGSAIFAGHQIQTRLCRVVVLQLYVVLHNVQLTYSTTFVILSVDSRPPQSKSCRRPLSPSGRQRQQLKLFLCVSFIDNIFIKRDKKFFRGERRRFSDRW